jgi:hypothetical protein
VWLRAAPEPSLLNQSKPLQNKANASGVAGSGRDNDLTAHFGLQCASAAVGFWEMDGPGITRRILMAITATENKSASNSAFAKAGDLPERKSKRYRTGFDTC